MERMRTLIKRQLTQTLFTLAVLAGMALMTIRWTTPPQPESFPPIHCVGDNDGFQCLKRHLVLLTQYRGVKTTFDDLKQLYARDANVISNCHQLTHVIGNTAVDMYDGNIGRAFLDGDSYCWSGFYHGVVERAVQIVGKNTFIASANSLCAEIPGKERYSFDYYNCVHGLGHGIMAITNDELFESLKLCDNLTGEWEKNSCYGGVFMENVMVDNRSHNSKYLKKDDLLYPCDVVDEHFKEQCYLMQTSYALTVTNYDFRAAFELCARADAGYENTCAQSIGRDASGSSVSNVLRTKASCALALSEEQQSNCIIGAVKDFISYFHGGAQANALCDAVDPRFTETCKSTAANYLKTL